MPVRLALRRGLVVIPPFVEIGGEFYAVIGWEPGFKPSDELKLRKLKEREKQLYRKLRRKAEIELYVNFISGE